MKECAKCTERKAIDEFRKNKLSHDGLSPWCLECEGLKKKRRKGAKKK